LVITSPAGCHAGKIAKID